MVEGHPTGQVAGAAISPLGTGGGKGLLAPALKQDGTHMQANLGSRQAPHTLALLPTPPPRPPRPPASPLPGSRATHSFVIGLLLLELLHHDAPLLVLAPLVLKPDPDHAGTEACHLHQLLLHERVWPGVGGIAGPQGVQLLLVQHSPNAGGLLGLLVHMGPQGRLPGRDGLGCEARGTEVSAGQAGLLTFPRLAAGTMACFAASTDKAGEAEVGTTEAKGKMKSDFLV